MVPEISFSVGADFTLSLEFYVSALPIFCVPTFHSHPLATCVLYQKLNFRYIRGAIGNAAWPIGLTMVGIHERSGRERISTSKVAHMMNNELERKYFTSVKRLMTFAQNKRTDVAPSMKMLG